MTARIRRVLGTFNAWQWLLLVVFVVAVAIAGLFAFSVARRAVYWRTHHDEPIQRWMTVNYVARSYDVPADALWSALGLPPARPPSRTARQPLSKIATAQGKSFEEVQATLESASAAERAKPRAPASTSPPPRSDRGRP